MKRAQVPRCTVLLPVYNGEAYLAEAIQSILRQTFQDFELLILDDGSTDGSVALARASDDARIRLEASATNQGMVTTLNRGLAMLQGEYIARMDADDIAAPDRLARQVAFLDEHPEVGMCGGYFRRFSPEHSGRTGLEQPALGHDAIQFQLLFRSGICHSSVMMRREVLQKHGLAYSGAYPCAEDYELWVRLGRVTRLANIPHRLIDYRVHGAGISGRRGAEQRHSARRIRRLQAANLGLVIRPEDELLYDQLLARALAGGAAELQTAAHYLALLEGIGTEQLNIPRRLVLRRLNDYWYHACRHAAHQGLPIFRLYCSHPFGWATRPQRMGKLLLHCLRRSR